MPGVCEKTVLWYYLTTTQKTQKTKAVENRTVDMSTKVCRIENLFERTDSDLASDEECQCEPSGVIDVGEKSTENCTFLYIILEKPLSRRVCSCIFQHCFCLTQFSAVFKIDQSVV